MTKGNPKFRVTKTDVARYLNDNSEAFPELLKYRDQYLENCQRARKSSIAQFGFWLQGNRKKIFDKTAKKLAKDPSILDALYGNQEPNEPATETEV